jgi:AhpD family alkylhydroperoxidase
MTTTYPIHTIESAPEKSQAALQGLQRGLGIIPNLAATMATSPVLINGFVGAFGNAQSGSFSNAQRQVLLLTNAVTNRCAWAVAFHSTLALKEGVAAADVKAIRARELPQEPVLAALSGLTRSLIEKRGQLDGSDLERFRAGGFGSDQVLEAIAVLAVSVMANYAGNITRPALEAAFDAQAWQDPQG